MCVKYWKSLFRVLTLESSFVKTLLLKKLVNGQLFFCIIFSLVQYISLKLTKILSTREGLLCSTNLVGPSISGVNQLPVNMSRNSFTSLFITFLFSLESTLRVCFKYRKNSVSFCFGCLYTTPTTRFSLLVYMISIQSASYSL